MTTDTWNPRQYERFRDERAQPYFDLLALVRPTSGMRVVDLGCGTGELTRQLHQRLQAAETVGIDSSPAMLAQSAQYAGDGLRFEPGDIQTFRVEQSVDLIFSNAAIQWVPDHPALLARLTTALAPRGQLAIQEPANHDHLSHLVAAEVAREAPFHEALGGYVRQVPVLRPEDYAVLLYQSGYREQHVRLQIYNHTLDSRAGVVEWVKGTLLTDYQRRLPADLWPEFLARYQERLLPQLDDRRPYYYPFKRLLFWAQR